MPIAVGGVPPGVIFPCACHSPGYSGRTGRLLRTAADISAPGAHSTRNLSLREWEEKSCRSPRWALENSVCRRRQAHLHQESRQRIGFGAHDQEIDGHRVDAGARRQAGARLGLLPTAFSLLPEDSTFDGDAHALANPQPRLVGVEGDQALQGARFPRLQQLVQDLSSRQEPV